MTKGDKCLYHGEPAVVLTVTDTAYVVMLVDAEEKPRIECV